jgi:N-acetylmuramoyl-L-alanine amidase
VLVGANMPAILVEMGYLTNATQEAQLLGGEFQARIAQAITEGVSQYFASAPAPLPQVAGVQFPLGASR